MILCDGRDYFSMMPDIYGISSCTLMLFSTDSVNLPFFILRLFIQFPLPPIAWSAWIQFLWVLRSYWISLLFQKVLSSCFSYFLYILFFHLLTVGDHHCHCYNYCLVALWLTCWFPPHLYFTTVYVLPMFGYFLSHKVLTIWCHHPMCAKQVSVDSSCYPE